MRSTRWARWAICALAITICVPAFAKTAKKSLSDCTSFKQTNKDDAKVELAIQNSCKVPVACKITWRVVCAPDSSKRRAVHDKTEKLTLTEGAGGSAEASAEICGDDAWAIESIQWGCEPNDD